MNIIVCIKQVPATEHLASVSIDPQTNTLQREKIPAIVNPFDMNAIEEAIRIKEKFGGKVTVITMGPSQAEEALRSALAMGADEAIMLTDSAFAGSDTCVTAKILARAIEKIKEYDLVLFGRQTIDGDTGQVGPEVAEFLSLPQITYVNKLEFFDGKIKATREAEDAYEEVEATLPCVVTVTKDINEPRFASIRGLLKAKKAEIIIWRKEDIKLKDEEVGLKGSPTQVVKVFTPLKKKKKGEILTGNTLKEKVDMLVEKLRGHHIV